MALYSPTPDKDHTKNMAIALVLCAILIVGWQFFVEIPKRTKLAEWQQQQEILKAQQKTQDQKLFESQTADKSQAANAQGGGVQTTIAEAPRVRINSETLHGSFSLRGLRFDMLTLANYNQTQEENSPEVQLLHPGNTAAPYFMQFGWLSDDTSLILPDHNTIWQTSGQHLTPDQPLSLSWDNGAGLIFNATISLDDKYMFTIKQDVVNQSGQPIEVKPYALINRAHNAEGRKYFISHEGPLAVVNGQLEELSYEDLDDEKQVFANSKGWLGFTDKYWLTALIPNQQERFVANFASYQSKGVQRYQSDYVGPAETVGSNERLTNDFHFFAGAKKLDILDHYTDGVDAIGLQPVALFDRSVDFGWLYFMTKPIFQTLNFFYSLIGNFGLAIILLTFCIKLLMFPLANKGYKSMTALKALQPEMKALKEKHGDDRMKMQQELLALYKKEKVNPASGCLPMLIQLPVFFALYKVLFVTIEMRHAHFWGPWQDLSAIDPTNLFTAFGLIDWNPPSFLMLGILPILMALTMMLQMRLQPTPQDPMQAKVMKLMPWFLLIVVARMPAGLVLYWVASNTLSIIQQYVIMRQYNDTHPNKQAK